MLWQCTGAPVHYVTFIKFIFMSTATAFSYSLVVSL